MTFKMSFTSYLKSYHVATPSQQVIWHLQNPLCIGISLSLKGGAFSCAQRAPEPQCQSCICMTSYMKFKMSFIAYLQSNSIMLPSKHETYDLLLHMCILPPWLSMEPPLVRSRPPEPSSPNSIDMTTSGLGSIPELELELIPNPIPGIGIEKELNKRNWNWYKGIDSIPFSYRQFFLIFLLYNSRFYPDYLISLISNPFEYKWQGHH